MDFQIIFVSPNNDFQDGEHFIVSQSSTIKTIPISSPTLRFQGNDRFILSLPLQRQTEQPRVGRPTTGSPGIVSKEAQLNFCAAKFIGIAHNEVVHPSRCCISPSNPHLISSHLIAACLHRLDGSEWMDYKQKCGGVQIPSTTTSLLQNLLFILLLQPAPPYPLHHYIL